NFEPARGCGLECGAYRRVDEYHRIAKRFDGAPEFMENIHLTDGGDSCQIVAGEFSNSDNMSPGVVEPCRQVLSIGRQDREGLGSGGHLLKPVGPLEVVNDYLDQRSLRRTALVRKPGDVRDFTHTTLAVDRCEVNQPIAKKRKLHRYGFIPIDR